MSTEIAILEKVRDRLADPSRFCQRNTAQDAAGQNVHYISPDAVRWCLYGALFKQYGRDVGMYPIIAEINNVAKRLFRKLPSAVNDGPDGHANVLRIIDETIAEYKAREATHDA